MLLQPAPGTLAARALRFPHTGLFIALAVLAGWTCTQAYALVSHTFSLVTTPVLLFILHQLYVLLFITAHDSIHGTVAPKRPLVNQAIGATCLALYACFDYDMMAREHKAHHKHAGRVKLDPDFHRGKPQALPWFRDFLMHYVTVGQFIKLAVQSMTLFIMGVSIGRIVLFTAVPGITAAGVLFYYGTYLPHKPGTPEKLERPEKFGTLQPKDGRLASFLKACNFGCHEEHHSNPHLPWWALYDAHKVAVAGAGAVKAN